MSLAKTLLNSLDDYEATEVDAIEEEPHIIVGSNREITVPAKLKLIAVKGDKDIETVTIDCVRYWDNHDLSTFAIYINYILPSGDEGTYIPKNITKLDDIFTFDWKIGNEITYAQGKLTFWIVAKLTDDSGDLIKQWSSLQNSDCSIAQGGDKIYVPEKQTDQDVISQAISVSRASVELAEQQANLAKQAAATATSEAKSEVERLIGELGVVQEAGESTTSVMSQKSTTEELNKRSNALVGKVSGEMVYMDDISPLEHKLSVKLSSETLPDNTQVTVKSYGKNLIPYPYSSQMEGGIHTQNGVTFTKNDDGGITINGTATADTSAFIYSSTSKPYPLIAGYYCFSGSLSDNIWVKIDKKDAGGKIQWNWGSNINKVGEANEGDMLYSISILVKSGTVCDNVVVYPQMERGTVATDYEPYRGETVTTTIADGAELNVVSPNMTIYTDNAGVVIDCTYNKDTNIVINKLTQAIINLGGSI